MAVKTTKAQGNPAPAKPPRVSRYSGNIIVKPRAPGNEWRDELSGYRSNDRRRAISLPKLNLPELSDDE